ncbi:MAG TPA: hypothetical protein VNX22_09010 [Acidobacteriaceae bacterium]|nr:hypothetical protein [Acidobacteriaceae bacterium]
MLTSLLAANAQTAAPAPPPAPPPAPAPPPSPAVPTSPSVSLDVVDLTPKFLAFYDEAQKEKANPDQRWELWKKLYGFAAVPPTPEGQAIARKLLDAAWPKYPAALDRIRQGVQGIVPKPHDALDQVSTLLAVDVPIDVRLFVYVGGFEGNAFTAPAKDGGVIVAIPVEEEHPGLLMTHEFTHALEAEQAGLSLDWRRSIAHTIFAEGLAMRATQSIHPGEADVVYVGEASPGWYERAQAKHAQILADITPHLAEDSSEAVMRYTMGKGGAGVEREAYYTGWLVIGDLLNHGWTFPRLARVTDPEMTKLCAESLARLQQAK